MKACHDSRQLTYRNPSGALPTAARLTLRVRTDAKKATLRLWWNDQETRLAMRRVPHEKDLFVKTLDMPAEGGLLWYFFILENKDETMYLGNAPDDLGGEGALYDHEPPSFQITVYDKAYAPPKWMADSIMYQIMVDRFCAVDPVKPPVGRLHENWDEPPVLDIAAEQDDNKADDFFGGNLRGVLSKLDYLQSLGVNVIYFNPIFESRSNHKYDTADYERIDPSFGDEADFRALCEECRSRGMRVILDGVFSHTGADSRYFNRFGRYDEVGAYQSEDSPYAPWYTFQSWPDEYDCWWGFHLLPNVNELEPSYLKYIVTGENAVAVKWLRAGASGWRLDVADELPMPFIRALRRRVKAEDPEAALIGEVWENASCKIAYDELRSYCLGDTLDSVMNYPLREGLIDFLTGVIDAPALKRRLDSLFENYPAPFYTSLMNLVGSHDKARVINRLSGCEPEHTDRAERAFRPLSDDCYALGRERFIKLWRFVCALPGMPCLYYGDEAGMQGGDDPFCRGTYPWGREDTALIDEIRRIDRARHASMAARHGSLALEADGPDAITAVRVYRSETLRVTLNRD